MATQSFQALRLQNFTGSVSTSPDLQNLGSQGAHIVIQITSITGTTPGAIFTVNGKDQTSNQYYPILESATLTTGGVIVLKILPGVTPAANLAVSDSLPRTFNIVCVTVGTITDLDCTVGVNLL
ncbi:hypothetical protein AB0L20_32310 [Streptomyces albidoflavus]|uniref:hypothetical protein n=1 Tax=Streptomyces albidoflavus TaxID=1886 RepID=UPI00342BCF0F